MSENLLPNTNPIVESSVIGILVKGGFVREFEGKFYLVRNKTGDLYFKVNGEIGKFIDETSDEFIPDPKLRILPGEKFVRIETGIFLGSIPDRLNFVLISPIEDEYHIHSELSILYKNSGKNSPFELEQILVDYRLLVNGFKIDPSRLYPYSKSIHAYFSSKESEIVLNPLIIATGLAVLLEKFVSDEKTNGTVRLEKSTQQIGSKGNGKMIDWPYVVFNNCDIDLYIEPVSGKTFFSIKDLIKFRSQYKFETTKE